MRKHVTKADLAKADVEIAQRLLPAALVEPLVVDFENPQKDVREARVQVRDFFDGMVMIDGVRAARSFAFSGDPDLFRLRTNPWSTALPYGEVRGSRVTIGMEGRNDPDMLKQEIERQERILREYVGYSKAQVDKHNADLERLLIEAVARRRQTLIALDALREQI